MATRTSNSIPRRRQQGTVLFVAMLVLVALAMAALALARSTDVVGLIAGNLAFKRSALNSTDLGVKAAFDYVTGLGNDTTAPPGGCYSASQAETASNGIPTVLADPATFIAAHSKCKTGGATESETVFFYTERLCAQDDTPAYDMQCAAARMVPIGMDTGVSLLKNVQPVYRTTVRVDGPRSTTSYAQVIWKRS